MMSIAVLKGTDNNGEMNSLNPPQIVLDAENTEVNGVMGKYCKEDTCVEHLRPDNPTMEATLMPMVKPKIEVDSNIDFKTNYKDPEIEYVLKDRRTGEEIEKGIYEIGEFRIREEGRYIVLIEADWDDRNVTYTYQIDVGN